MSQTFPPVRLAALDLDGTLLNHEGQVTPRTRAALQAASDRGALRCCITALPRRDTRLPLSPHCNPPKAP